MRTVHRTFGPQPSLRECWTYFAQRADQLTGEHREYLLRHCGRLAWISHRALQLTRQGDRILEAGCAWADVARFLGQCGRAVVGLDDLYCPERIEGFAFVRSNLERAPLPFRDASFPCVIFTEVLEHFATSPVPALIELRRVTTPGGVILVSTPNQMSIGHVTRLLANRSNLFQPLESKLSSDWALNRFHNHIYTRHELQLLFCDHLGLKARRLRFTNFLPGCGPEHLLRDILRFGCGLPLPLLRTYLYGEFQPRTE
ncbi:MAG: class I SAM-dependent methyltransferase [Bryobacteraceae bacterium]